MDDLKADDSFELSPDGELPFDGLEIHEAWEQKQRFNIVAMRRFMRRYWLFVLVGIMGVSVLLAALTGLFAVAEETPSCPTEAQFMINIPLYPDAEVIEDFHQVDNPNGFDSLRMTLLTPDTYNRVQFWLEDHVREASRAHRLDSTAPPPWIGTWTLSDTNTGGTIIELFYLCR